MIGVRQMRFVILAMMVLVGNVHAADVYKWTGPDGRAHFGDRPPADTRAEEVRVRSFSGAAEIMEEGVTRMAKVVLLTTSWCAVCKQAKQYLAAKGVPYVELDVEKSEAGRAEYKRLNGRGVPIVLVGKQRMDGFSAPRFDQMLEVQGR